MANLELTTQEIRFISNNLAGNFLILVEEYYYNKESYLDNLMSKCKIFKRILIPYDVPFPAKYIIEKQVIYDTIRSIYNRNDLFEIILELSDFDKTFVTPINNILKFYAIRLESFNSELYITEEDDVEDDKINEIISNAKSTEKFKKLIIYAKRLKNNK